MKPNIPPRIIIIIILAAIIIAAVFNSCTMETNQLPANQKLLTKEMYGDKWALTVDTVIVECKDTHAFIVYSNGVAYGLNGTAQSWFKLKDAIVLVKDHPETIKMNYQYLFDEAEKLCK